MIADVIFPIWLGSLVSPCYTLDNQHFLFIAQLLLIQVFLWMVQVTEFTMAIDGLWIALYSGSGSTSTICSFHRFPFISQAMWQLKNRIPRQYLPSAIDLPKNNNGYDRVRPPLFFKAQGIPSSQNQVGQVQHATMLQHSFRPDFLFN